MTKEKIVVFGAAGRFNQILVPRLIEEGFTVRTFDPAAMNYDCECIQASTADYLAVERATKGMDIAINAAGLHYLPRGTDHPENYEAYWETNYVGTHHVFLAAIRMGVRKVIFSSSLCYYDWTKPGIVDEDWPAARPAPSIYDLSKVVGEDMARFYVSGHGLEVIALRYGNFCGDPEPGFDFLHSRLRRDDSAQANYLCIRHQPESGFEAFNVVAGCPFQPADLEGLLKSPMDVLDTYYPGLKAFLKEKNLTWEGQQGYVSIEKAKSRLGFGPKFTFETYLEKIGFLPLRRPPACSLQCPPLE
jgi:nucleoside-diphosphate-sugar epimerase